mgnify:CR=1 FL=1
MAMSMPSISRDGIRCRAVEAMIPERPLNPPYPERAPNPYAEDEAYETWRDEQPPMPTPPRWCARCEAPLPEMGNFSECDRCAAIEAEDEAAHQRSHGPGSM